MLIVHMRLTAEKTTGDKKDVRRKEVGPNTARNVCSEKIDHSDVETRAWDIFWIPSGNKFEATVEVLRYTFLYKCVVKLNLVEKPSKRNAFLLHRTCYREPSSDKSTILFDHHSRILHLLLDALRGRGHGMQRALRRCVPTPQGVRGEIRQRDGVR